MILNLIQLLYTPESCSTLKGAHPLEIYFGFLFLAVIITPPPCKSLKIEKKGLLATAFTINLIKLFLKK